MDSPRCRSPKRTLAHGTIGVVGVGRMGAAVCARLVEAGFSVVAGDRDADRAAAARAAGTRWADSPRELASRADFLITVLPGTAELVDAIDTVGPELRRGSCWIDMTSCAPDAAAATRDELVARGVDCLEAPAGGDPDAARAGGLQLFVGGPIEAAERCRVVLEALGRIEHMGGAGAGYTTKLLVNLMWFGQALATAEALLVARRAGLDIDVLRDTLARSPAGSRFIEDMAPRLLDGDYLASFGLDRCCEELDAIAALAESQSVPFTVSSAVRGLYREALDRYGRIDGELLAVALLEERAGIRLRRSDDGAD
jgi:3-hydroxyisobutyrate dehydrogenase